MEAKNISFRNFDRFNNRYELAKATPKGAPVQKKSNSDVTRKVVKTQFTGKFIACTTFMKMPRVQAAGGFTTDRDENGRLIVVGRRTGKRIPFTKVASTFREDCKHAFQKVIDTYSDGTTFESWMLMNAILPSKKMGYFIKSSK